MATACLAWLTFPTTFAITDAAMLRELSLVNGLYEPFILAAAEQFGLQPSVVCGLGSRESGWGLRLTPPGAAGTGDFAPRKNTKPFRAGALPSDGKGFGRGLLQIDYDAFEFAQAGNWHDPEANIAFGCKVLHDGREYLAQNTSLQGLPLMRAALAAYNCGAGNVHKAVQQARDVDVYTAHGNYSADVLSRAGFFQAHGWE